MDEGGWIGMVWWYRTQWLRSRRPKAASRFKTIKMYDSVMLNRIKAVPTTQQSRHLFLIYSLTHKKEALFLIWLSICLYLDDLYRRAAEQLICLGLRAELEINHSLSTGAFYKSD